MAKRKQYIKEFKLEAVRLANEPDQSFLQVSKNLGISDSVVLQESRQAAKRDSADSVSLSQG